jgi:hypothetical protein
MPTGQFIALSTIAVLPRTVPTLISYADGLVNFNAEATALLNNEIDFYTPRPHRTRAGNPRRPNLWEVGPGLHKLIPASRGGYRVRMGKQAPPAGRYLLTPIAYQPGRYTLVPCVT